MKKYTLVVFAVLLIFSGCNPRTNTPQSLETSSEPVKSSSIESSSSSLSSSSNSSADISSDINSGSSISNSTESQNSHSISSSSLSAPAQTVIEPDTTTVYIEFSSNIIKLDQISDSFQIPYKIINNSSREVQGGPEYTVERYDGSDWVLLPYNEDVIPNWPSVVFSIYANTAFDCNLSFFQYDEGFVSGTYRIVQYVWEEGKSGIPLYAEFSVIE